MDCLDKQALRSILRLTKTILRVTEVRMVKGFTEADDHLHADPHEHKDDDHHDFDDRIEAMLSLLVLARQKM